MVEMALEEAGFLSKIEMFIIDDIPDDSKWVEHVESHAPQFTHVYSGEGLHYDLFEATKKYEMVKLSRINEIYATKIREAVVAGEKWEDLVPKPVVGELKKMGLWRITSFKGQ
jgi:nicotinamide-nucleotide adenylyltransferase